MIPTWINKYIGIPYDEKNCLELLKFIYKEESGIILPKYDNYVNDDHIESIEKQFNETNIDWIKLDKPEPMCLIMMNIAGHPVHIGLCLDETYMIHTLRGHNSAIEKHNSIKWKRRIEGFYKWPFM